MTTQASAKPVDGAQSIRRALAVLRLLAAGQEMGVRLTDLAATSGLRRPTLHRILRVLVEGRLALAARLGVDTDDDYGRLHPADLGALDYLAQLQVLLLDCLELPSA